MQSAAEAGDIRLALLRAAARAGLKLFQKSTEVVAESPKLAGVVTGAFLVGVFEGAAATKGHEVGSKTAEKEDGGGSLTVSEERYPVIELANRDQLKTALR
ncbi:MAG TPA: hypothetical protein VGD54_09420 [Steroidobacteraceae bacterium]